MSELIAWDDSLSVGIDEIDEQHKVLVRLLNDLDRAIKEHHGNEACLACCNARPVDCWKVRYGTWLRCLPALSRQDTAHARVNKSVV